VILGRGGAGKSTFARRLGTITGLPVVELDQQFWQPGQVATTPERWVAVQQELVADRAWILDGDLGPYDVLGRRLDYADTVIVLDFSLLRCSWRSVRRSRERLDYWRWLVAYRRRHLPTITAMIATHAPNAAVYVLRDPTEADELLREIADTQALAT